MWVARDKQGELWLYKNEPYRSGDIWDVDAGSYGVFDDDEDLFSELTWEDDPVEVGLMIAD